LARVSATLPADAVLFSFRLGESASWLWAVDRAGLVLYRLPPQDQLQRTTAAALEAIRHDKPDAKAAAANLYAGLFGGVARVSSEKRGGYFRSTKACLTFRLPR